MTDHAAPDPSTSGVQTDDAELLERWPRIRLDPDNAAYYAGLLRRQYLINRCSSCGWWHVPPRPICPQCWSHAVQATEVSGRGTVQLVTHVWQPPGPEPGVPRTIAGIELDEQPGLRVSGVVTGVVPTAVVEGLRVELQWTERDSHPFPLWHAIGVFE